MKIGQIKRRWNPGEDELLKKLIEEHGAKNWSFISQLNTSRTAKSCRKRWCNHLNTQLDHQPFTPEEEDIIFKAHDKFTNQWAIIASLLPGRTNVFIKNHWNSNIKRKHSSMSEDLTFEKPQLPLQRSSSVWTCINLGSPSKSHLSNLEFSRFPQLCLYPPTIPYCQNLPHSTYSPVIPYPFTSLTFYGSDLSNLSISRYPWLSLYPYVAQLSEIFPFSSGLQVLPGPSTTLILSLSGFKSSKNLNPINRIDQEDEVTLVSASESNPSNFMPQTSITQSGNSGLTSMEKQLLSPNILTVLQEMIRKEVKNYVSELENERDSRNTETIMDATAKIVSKD